MKQTRSRMVLATILWIIALPATMVFAGELNSQETRLIQSVQTIYEYEGKTYQVNPEYLTMLRGYLMQDDVDLTAAEVDSIIPQVMDNVSTGITDGYLIEIPAKVTQTPTQEVTATPTKTPTSTPTQVPTVSPIQGNNDVPTTTAPIQGATDTPTTITPIQGTTDAPTTTAPTKGTTDVPTTIAPTQGTTDTPTTIAPDQDVTATQVPLIHQTGTNSGPGNGVGMTNEDVTENGRPVDTNEIENTEGSNETSQDINHESYDSKTNQETNNNQDTNINQEIKENQITGLSIHAAIIIGGVMVIIIFITLIMAYRVRQLKR